MTDVTDLMREIHRFMNREDNYYLLSRIDRGGETWRAAEALVALGVARWLPETCGLRPGIVLTGRPLP